MINKGQAALTCPSCGSATIRVSRRQNLMELSKMTFGTYPFRCITCSQRFWANIWLWSVWKYAKCPRCLSLDLTSWTRKPQHVGYWKRLLVTLGAKRHRCSRCRYNFVSFRPNSPLASSTGIATSQPATDEQPATAE